MNAQLPADTHTHTRLCRHAGGDPIDYARAAAARGIPEIACTDHIYFPNDPHPSIRMAREEFAVYLGLVLVMFGVYPLLLRLNRLSVRQFFAGAWPAIQLGFKPFDPKKAGVYGDEAWIRKANEEMYPADEIAPPPPAAPGEKKK